jgi:hypothetical protein
VDISEIMINRTTRALGINSKKLGGNFGSKAEWYWSLPVEDGQDGQDGPEGGHTLGDDHLQASHSSKNTSGKGLAEDGQSAMNDHLQDHLQQDDADQSVEEGEL